MEINIIINCVLLIYYNNILFKKEKKQKKICVVSIFAILPPAGFEPMTLEFSTYLPNYLTCPNQLRYRLLPYFEWF